MALLKKNVPVKKVVVPKAQPKLDAVKSVTKKTLPVKETIKEPVAIDSSLPHKEIVPSLARVESGIPGLDKLLHGGFPEISTVMVSGSSGTGKTMFITQSLFRAAALGKRVLYITFSEPVYKVINFASNLDFFNLQLVDSGKYRIMDLGPMAEKKSVREIIEAIKDACVTFKPRMVGIDPVTMIGYLAETDLGIRQATLELGNALSELGITTVLGSEAPLSEAGYSRFGVEEYMADMIIFLRHEPLEKGKEVNKTLEIVKMRGSTHESGRHTYTITEKGMVLTGGKA
jgi:circadian clock protein KaiC